MIGILVLSLAGCGVAEKAKEKAAERVAEKLLSAEGMISWGGANEADLRLALTHQDDCFSITLIQEE